MSSIPGDPDEELVAAAQRAGEGDSRAFEKLVRRHQEQVVTNCRYLTRASGDAEDLAQEVFVKAFFAIPRFERRSSFKSWLQRIKVNHCLNFIKKSGGRTFVDVADPVVASNPEMSVEPRAERLTESVEHRERIGHVLDAMNDTLRIPLIMRDMDELPYQEIADALGIGLSATKMRIKRAREEFRRRYEAQEGVESSRGGAVEGSQA